MKKKILCLFTILIIMIFGTTVFAVQETNELENKTQLEISETKNEVDEKINKYIQDYNSESYGYTAYVLTEIIRPYSIPVCFIGIVIGALYQYVLGTRRLDLKHRGFGLIIGFVTLLVICQILPLIFTVVVLGWRG